MHGTPFLKENSKTKSFDEITPDDYKKFWRGVSDGSKFKKKSMENILDETGHGDVYGTIYSPSSGWGHWDSLSLQGAITVDDENIIYGVETKFLGVVAHAIGFDALNDTAKLLDDHFKLGRINRLTTFGDDQHALLKHVYTG
jgi:hypothetical protein